MRKLLKGAVEEKYRIRFSSKQNYNQEGVGQKIDMWLAAGLASHRPSAIGMKDTTMKTICLWDTLAGEETHAITLYRSKEICATC